MSLQKLFGRRNNIKRLKKEKLHLVITLFIGVLLGILFAWLIQPFNSARVKFIEGYASVNGNGDAIGFRLNRDNVPEEGYSIAGADWRGLDGIYHTWETSGYSCLNPLDKDKRVRLGIIEIMPSDKFGGRNKVVSLECLD
jgi:hypothetical protein